MMGLTLIQIILCIVVLVLKDDKIFINDYIFGIPTESLSLLAFVFCHEMPMTMRIIIPILYLVPIFIFLQYKVTEQNWMSLEIQHKKEGLNDYKQLSL